uniref:Nondiscriminating glutamyl-tRNA synthetase EARS2, mitochondrial n=1 Tax=Parascaris univalens TaxID=6257 RepID=A0A915BGB4_PARUN
MVLIQKMPVSSSSILYRWRCSRLKSTPTASGVRVRFAPSPTGKMHLGGLRTALYNFLFARSHSGSFIVRIEDTDQQRTVQGAARQIEEILDHFELYRDEGPSKGGPFGPYVQSQRLNTYVDAAERLIDAGHAYRCFCSQERLKMLRREALRKRETPRYDNLCRGLSREETAARMRGGEPSVVRFKMKQKDITFQDEVFGIISQVFDEGDFVLLKSDSYPTYHLANVVDDHAMRISHIIRGMEWISSTPKHVQLYRAFDWEQPLWLHLPLITRDGSRKLSKRDEDAFVEFYREQEGYLPLAVLNFLVRNGSGIRDFRANHLYTLEEMVENFDHTTIGRRNFMMDQQSLDKYGRLAFQKADFEKTLLPEISNYLRRRLPPGSHGLIDDETYMRKIVDFLWRNEEGFARLSQLSSGQFKFFFSLASDASKVLDVFNADLAFRLLSEIRNHGSRNLECLRRLASERSVSYPQLLLLIRLTLIDAPSGPPITELFEFFGSDECNKRFDGMMQMLAKYRRHASECE